MVIIQHSKEGKFVSESAIENRKIELFSDNFTPHGIIFGGKILNIVDKMALEVAQRHAEHSCEMQGIDFVRFIAPAKKNDILHCRVFVTKAWSSSLEVEVKVTAEDFRLLEKKDILTAYFTFISLDDDRCRVGIPKLIPETEEQKKNFIEAEKRRRLHLR